MTTWAIIAFSGGTASDSPNIRSKSDAIAMSVYRTAIDVVLASIKRSNPETVCVIATDTPQMFKRVRATLWEVPFRHRPRTALHNRFSSSLYLLDAMQAATENVEASDVVLFIDPDCLIIRPLDPIVEVIKSTGIAALPIHYHVDHDINGISRRSAAQVAEVIDGRTYIAPHYGGEFYGFIGKRLETVVRDCETAYLNAASLADAGEHPRFTTEEHILSFALSRTDPIFDLNPYVKRVWTARSYRNVDGHEYRLVAWHLPAEKHRGFRKLHKSSQDRQSAFWTAKPSDFINYVALVMGVRRRPGRVILDFTARTITKVRKQNINLAWWRAHLR